MQFKGLLMTQAGRHPLQNSPAALLPLSSLGTQKPLFVSPPVFAFLLAPQMVRRVFLRFRAWLLNKCAGKRGKSGARSWFV